MFRCEPFWEDWVSLHLNGKMTFVPDVDELPKDGSLYQILDMQGIKTLITLPLYYEGRCLGFVGFDAVKEKYIWHDKSISLLKILAELITNAYIRKEIQSELQTSYKELENRVEERTSELREINNQLLEEINVRTTMEKEINKLAYYDPLTGLSNRRLFQDRLTQAVLNASRTGKTFGVVFLDIDAFKTINDSLGHTAGDELLIGLAERLKHTVRKSDTLARVGGDEFLFLLQNITDENGIKTILENIMLSVSKPFKLQDKEFFITASLGCAVFPVDGDTPETLIKNADIAMYHAKENGKNRYAFASSLLHSKIVENLRITNSLYRALERNELELHYQPKVNIDTNRIVGAEALLRWHNSELGNIKPFDFIPIAEKTGLILPIGEWVIHTACEHTKRWQSMGLGMFPVSVNISAAQFHNNPLVEQVQSALVQNDLHPSYLDLEITESTMIQDLDYILDILMSLKELGVRISIDDFGTKYSSLAQLKNLPVDKIKIDRSFINGTDYSNKDQAITKAIIMLARNMGVSVIAEGAESQSQIDFLKESMCHEVQGYFYYKPMPAGDFEELMKAQPK